VAVLVALGRQLAAVPYLESVVLGAGTLARFGSEELQREWATPAINGSKILAVALDGEMGEGPVQAQAVGEAYRLTGSRTQVSYGPVADAFLVPAETDTGTKVFLIAKDDSGVTVTSLDTTGHGSVAQLELQGVEAARVVGGEDVLAWLTAHGNLGRSAYQLGVLERALELTSTYARERQQFDRPIGSFQAVSSRSARRRSGRPTPDIAWRTRPFTCTAESGSTPTTRSTGISLRPSRRNSPSAARPASCCASAVSWPTRQPRP
jgi:3-oxocholest-4-en-26-oyl-CoA dehydrogenase beta subunit